MENYNVCCERVRVELTRPSTAADEDSVAATERAASKALSPARWRQLERSAAIAALNDAVKEFQQLEGEDKRWP